MLALSTALAGVITILLLVVLGIFVYPRLLKKTSGIPIVIVVTLLIALGIFIFDSGHGTAIWPAALLSLFWAGAPAIAGVIVYRLGDKASPRE
jgi:hypothetical protein